VVSVMVVYTPDNKKAGRTVFNFLANADQITTDHSNTMDHVTPSLAVLAGSWYVLVS
jgi:hypothetical protein